MPGEEPHESSSPRRPAVVSFSLCLDIRIPVRIVGLVIVDHTRYQPPMMHDLEILEHADTPIGTIYLGRRDRIGGPGQVYEIMIDGALLMSSVSPVSEQRLSSSSLALHQGQTGLRVLIGGLGLGYTAEAALKDERVEEVRVVEKMDFVIDWMKGGFFPLSKEFAADQRMSIDQGDVYAHLLGAVTQTYDVILVDVDHAPDDPLSPASVPFYTVEGQQQVARHLNPGGVLAVWSAHDNDEFAAVLDEVYPLAKRENVEWEDDETKLRSYQNTLFLGV